MSILVYIYTYIQFYKNFIHSKLISADLLGEDLGGPLTKFIDTYLGVAGPNHGIALNVRSSTYFDFRPK